MRPMHPNMGDDVRFGILMKCEQAVWSRTITMRGMHAKVQDRIRAAVVNQGGMGQIKRLVYAQLKEETLLVLRNYTGIEREAEAQERAEVIQSKPRTVTH